VTWSSRIPDLVAELPNMVVAGLDAGTAVIADAVRDELRGGYTSGEYVTGANVNSVIRPAAFRDTDGALVQRVTTRLTDPPYPWYWEMGFFSSTITGLPDAPLASSVGGRVQGRFIRVEKWRPAAEKSADAASTAFAVEVSARLDALLGGTLPGGIG
jgi:hypothetical protein